MEMKRRLREQLEQESPELYASLMRSWEIAEKEWLPAMSSKMGSYNSLPHITGVEAHADNILAQVDNDNAPYETTLRLSPCEKYVLLASVLLHDIGRIKDSDYHGELSRDTIRKKHTALGIEHKHLAEIIGEVCCFHECGNKKTKETLDLRDRDIEPYGLIRVKPLAILLALFDELDGSYKRVYPYYLETSSLVEGFRRSTTNIRTDVSSMTIISCADIDKKQLFEISSEDIKWEDISFGLNKDFLEYKFIKDDETDKWRNSVKKKVQYEEYMDKKTPLFPMGFDIVEMLAQAKTGKNKKLNCSSKLRYFTYFDVDFNPTHAGRRLAFITQEQDGSANKRYVFTPQECTKQILPSLYGWFYDSTNPSYHVLPYLVLLGLVYADGEKLKKMRDQKLKKTESKDKEKICSYFEKTLAVNKFIAVAANVHAAARKLENFKDELAEYGIPFMAWVLEHDDHLFTWHGQETFEASFDKHFLKDLVNRMWYLAAGTFGRKPFTYETLAAKLRVDNIERVKLAVRRIAIISRHNHEHLPKEERDRYPKTHSAIHYTESGWWWETRDDWGAKGDKTSNKFAPPEHSVESIFKLIENLIEPHYVDPFVEHNA